jgi:rhodanese-related sulfurtransferase
MANLLINLARVPDPVPAPLPSPVPWPVSRTIMGGMSAWTFDREVAPVRFDDDRGTRRIENGAVATTPTPAVDQGAFPALATFSAPTDGTTRKALVRARAFLADLAAEDDGPDAWWVDFVEYQALLADGEPANDPVVLSARNLPDYNKGHVPGAFNIPYAQVAKLANFRNVSPTRTVFAYCYTGHTGALATMALGILGYDVRNLLWGMNGWTLSSAAASGQLNRFDIARSWDFPLHGDAGESLAAYVPEATGCKGCHTNLTALYSELAYTEPPAPGAISEGEG